MTGQPEGDGASIVAGPAGSTRNWAQPAVNDRLSAVTTMEARRGGLEVSDTTGIDAESSVPILDESPPRAGRQARDMWVRSGFDQAAIGLAILDGAGRHVLVNTAYAQQTGRPKSAVVGSGLIDAVDSGSRHLIALWQKAPQQPTTLEVTLDRAGVGSYDATMLLSPMQGREHESHVLVQLVGTDSTPTARDSAARLRAVVDHIDELVLMTRADGVLTYVSPSVERSTGRPAAALIGSAFDELVHPDDRAAILGATRTGRSSAVDIHVRLSGPNGLWTTHECRISEVRDQMGRLLGLAHLARPTATGEGLTESPPQRPRQTRSTSSTTSQPANGDEPAGPPSLITSTDASAIVTDSPDLIWQFDHDGPVFANPAARTMIGLTADGSLDGIGLGHIHPQWTVERIAHHGVAQTLAGAVWEDHLAVVDAGGHEVPVSYVLVGHRDERGAVTHWSSISRPLERMLETEAQIRWAATHDPLTALPGRTLLLDRVEVALARATRTGQRVGLLLLDLDFFEAVNSSVGSDIADRLLQAIAERLKTSIRPGDTIGRMGEDEFIVLCEHFDQLDDAERFAERLLHVVEDPINIDGADWFVSMSVGIALARQAVTTPDRLLRNANAAMYRAKELGRGRHVVFGNTLASPELPFSDPAEGAETPGT